MNPLAGYWSGGSAGGAVGATVGSSVGTFMAFHGKTQGRSDDEIRQDSLYYGAQLGGWAGAAVGGAAAASASSYEAGDIGFASMGAESGCAIAGAFTVMGGAAGALGGSTAGALAGAGSARVSCDALLAMYPQNSVGGETGNDWAVCPTGHSQTLSGHFSTVKIWIGGGTWTNKTILSCRADGLVDLYSHDDASGRQQWCLCPDRQGWYHIIVNGGTNPDKKYLSCRADGLVDLYSHDDGSGRQRWVLHKQSDGKVNIHPLGGTHIDKKILSCRADGLVDLYSHDDGSLRQRWTITNF